MVEKHSWLQIKKEHALAFGKPIPSGFVVRQDSTAMRVGSPDIKRDRPERDRLVKQGVLVPDENPALFRFSSDHVFSSKSRAAGVVIDGNSNGDHWRSATVNLPARIEEKSVFTRSEIEGAMDAFDRYGNNNENAEIFSKFGDPLDYWVRSSCERRNCIYPTKPIFGFILSKTELNGGWGQRTDAAARLHNSGFIIVDQNDKPVPPPERYEHLIRDADRIRLCAANYYIEPARENDARDVSIRAGDLAKDMDVRNAIPLICSALGGEKLQRLIKVPAPAHTEPNPSSSTVFTYQLAMEEGQHAMTSDPSVKMPSTTNLILYGPPGTGKTYATAWEAVRLCIGDESAARLRHDRNALMAEYRRLASEGRIEFVTFHQSMSYEEFVEGLRPTTGAGEDAEHSGGFRLEPVPGIFQRISRRAEASADAFLSGDAEHERQEPPITLEGRNARQMPLSRLADTSVNQAFEEPSDQNAAEQLFTAGEMPAVHVNSFRHQAQEVILQMTDNHPDGFSLKQYRDALVIAGSIRNNVPTGGWEHHNMPNWVVLPKQRWLVPIELVVGKASATDASHGKNMNYVRSSTPSRTKLPAQYVLIIDEINRANISKVLGELITLLEIDKRLGNENEIQITLPYSKKPFGVPANLHIIGTMNTADRSIALLDTALRRRFTFHELMPDPSIISKNLGGINLQKLLTTINDRIEYLFDREHQIGHAYFTSCVTQDDIADVMRHKVIPLLAEYFYEDWSKVAAVLGDTGQGAARFLEARRLAAPAGLAEDDFAGEKLRWSVKDSFDFSEFAS
jgi:5-methylcytosine-specific restriction protein B